MPLSCSQAVNGKPPTPFLASPYNLCPLLLFSFFLCYLKFEGGKASGRHLSKITSQPPEAWRVTHVPRWGGLWCFPVKLFLKKIFIKKKNCVKHRAKGMAEGKASYCSFFSLGTIATIKHLHSHVSPVGEKPQGKVLIAQERKLPLPTHSFPQNVGK